MKNVKKNYGDGGERSCIILSTFPPLTDLFPQSFRDPIHASIINDGNNSCHCGNGKYYESELLRHLKTPEEVLDRCNVENNNCYACNCHSDHTNQESLVGCNGCSVWRSCGENKVQDNVVEERDIEDCSSLKTLSIFVIIMMRWHEWNEPRLHRDQAKHCNLGHSSNCKLSEQ